jgi:AcrR family transcriptional regulator
VKHPDEHESLSQQSVPRRVGRPRRLSTPVIVSTAIEIADEQGLEQLSMPKLATRLGVGTMTIYGYVDNKEDLLDRIAERIFEGLEVPDHDDWRQGLFRFFSDFRAAALAHPSLVRLLASGRITIPAVFDILENTFQEMTDDGVPIEEAVRIFYTALTYTIGFVFWEIPRAHSQAEGAYAQQWADLIAQLDAGRYPIITGVVTDVAPTVASPVQFDWGLSRVLTG